MPAAAKLTTNSTPEAILLDLLRAYVAGGRGAPPCAPTEPQAVCETAKRCGLLRHALEALRALPPATQRHEWFATLMPLLETGAARQAARAALVHAEGQRVLAALATAGIRCIPYKGTFLSEDLYGDATFRRAGDIDVIIAGGRDGCAAAIEVLTPLGYRLPFTSPPVRQYFRAVYGECPLVCSAGATVDLHYAPSDDLPAGAYDDLFARARPLHARSATASSPSPQPSPTGRGSKSEGSRLRPDALDLLLLLSVHFWTVPVRECLPYLADLAVLLGKRPVFEAGWLARTRGWRLQFIVAATLAALEHALLIRPAGEVVGALDAALTSRQRHVCRRLHEQGRSAVPDGLVQKLHRLRLPSGRRLRLIGKFLWPHPGRIEHETGKPARLLRRLCFACRRLRQALSLR